MARPGSIESRGSADAERPALVLDDRRHLGGQLRRVGRVVLGRVGDAEAAAEVHLGHLDADLRAHGGVQRQHPARGDLEARGVEDLAADVGVQAEQVAAPGASCTRRTASSASPLAIEKPNFWSSWAVAMYSWVCASTPAVTRTITPVVRPSSRGDLGQALDLVEGVDDDAARRRARRRARARASVLLLPWKPTRSIGKPARSATSQLAARADVEREPLLGQPADDRRAEERLAGVVDVVVGEGVAEGTRPGAEVVLVQDVRRGAVLADQLGQRHSPDASTPSVLGAVCDQRCATSSLGSSGSRSQWGRPAGRRRRAPSRTGARWARTITSARERRRRAGAGRWRARSGSRRRAPGRARVQVG